jgi:hypothetical protein
MDQGIKMMISCQLPKSMIMLNLQGEEAFSPYSLEEETYLKEKLITLFNRFIKNITQASKSFQWNKKINRLMQLLLCKIFSRKLSFKKTLRKLMTMLRLKKTRITLKNFTRKLVSLSIQCKLFVTLKSKNANMILEKTVYKNKCSAISNKR